MIQNYNIISNILTAVMSEILFLFFVNLHIFYQSAVCIMQGKTKQRNKILA